ncbi:zinc finger protein 708-like isoform X8 [Nymphalis io]|uniref:zinc finger protein 708-like isoform X8 n=1 Tax=Inachis io TaxID=171585 RepID=UPI0021696AC4|nr:zinc finger protein 708-like isoform X8 [Nymphalis io]
MESISNEGMCRCCASEGTFKDFLTSYHWMGEEEIYADMLRDCFAITLYTSDDVNNGGICEVCITQLRNACNFKRQVQQTEEQFKKRVQNSGLKSNVIKLEMAGGDDGEHSDTNLSDEFSAAEFEVPIKEEKDEEKPKKRQAAKPSTSRAKKAKTEDGEPSAKRLRGSQKQIYLKDTLDPKIENNEEGKLKLKKGGELQKHRSNVNEILMNSNATPIRCRGAVGYACCFCTKQFPDPADLKKHTIESHDEKAKLNFLKRKDMYKFHVKLDITELKCNMCYNNIDTLEKLIDHLKDVHDIKMFTDIKNQVLPFKFDTERLRCFICMNIYHKFKSLLEHMNVHYRNYVCEVCNAGFVSRAILVQHEESHKLGTFKCDHCPKIFETLRKKRSHEKGIHTHSDVLNKCGYCDEKFKDYRKKEKHLVDVHGIGNPLKCQSCEKTFANQKVHTVHIKRLHLMDRRHKCSECDMTFFSSAELKSHFVKHTGLRKFECEVCHKAYGRKKTLREHMRIHANDKRFKCEHCGQSFVQKCRWRGHVRAKHGEQV